MPQITSYAMTILALCLTVLLPAADEQAMIGYRNDGTGNFPADCKPVHTWGGSDIEKGTNIVWKTKLELWSNSSPIVAGGKLFVQCDRGGFAYSNHLVPDFIGNLLVCIDPATGDVLWKKDLNHLDKLPEKDRQQAEKSIREWNTFRVEGGAAFQNYRQIAGPLLGGGQGVKLDYSKEMPEGYEAVYRDAAEAFKSFWPEVPMTIAGLKAKNLHPRDGGIGGLARMLTHNYPQFVKFVSKINEDRYQQYESLPGYGYPDAPWFGFTSFVGSTMQTPVSDGKHLYIQTCWNDIYCVDLDGEIVWSHYFGRCANAMGAAIGSPILIGDTLIITGGGDQSSRAENKNTGYIRALDTQTGKVLWHAKGLDFLRSYTRITPVPLKLPIGDGDTTVDIIWTGAGNVLRVSDGKVLATKVGCHGNGRHVGWCPDQKIIVLLNGSSVGGKGMTKTYPQGTVALRFSAKSADELVIDTLWQDAAFIEYMVVDGAAIYGYTKEHLEKRNLLTGDIMAKTPITDTKAKPKHFSAIADGHLFALNDNICTVTSIGNDSPEKVATNTLGPKRGKWFCQGSQPFISGNRIFIQSYQAVYCIGETGSTLRLSTAHQ